MHGQLRFLAIPLLLSALAAHANSVYLSQSGGTFSGGAACNGQSTQTASTYFNNASNWTSGTPTGSQIGPGSNVYVCGALVAPYNSPGYLTFQGSGSSGNLISLIFDTGASLKSPSFNGEAIELNGKSYITINGGGTGVIQSTLNGTSGEPCPGGTCTYQNGDAGIYGASASSNILIENLTIGPMYDRYCPSGEESMCGDENGGDSTGVYIQGGSNVTIQNNTITGGWTGAGYGPGGSSATSVSFIGNTVYQCNIGIQVSNGSAGDLINGIVVKGNNIYDGYNWSDTANNNHHDGMHLFSVASGSENENLQVYNNFVHGNWGDGVNAWIFIECNSGGTCPSPQVFNNILEDDTTVSHAGNGLLSVDGTNPLVANNTLNGAIGGAVAGLWSGTGLTFYNNVTENSYGAFYSYNGTGTITHYDYNITYLIGAGQWGGGSNQYSFTTWKSNCSCDSHSINGTNPNIPSSTGTAANYIPSSGSIVVGAATNLTSLSITPLDSDFASSARPGSGAWDVGAYNHGGATFTLTVSKSGTGTGTLAGTNCATGTYASGATITCTESWTSGNVFTGWGGNCSGMGTCSFSLAANSAVTATFVSTTAQYLNIDTLTPASIPPPVTSSPGWNINNIPSDTGGVNTPASVNQTIGNSSPAGGCTSLSMLITETTIATSTQTNTLFWYFGTGSDGSTNFIQDECVYITNIAAADNIEIDFDQYNLTQNRLYSFGHQCHIGGFWQYANNSSGWQNTSVSCSLTGNAWHHIIWTGHRVTGDTSCSGVACNYYDSLTIDGTTSNINTTLPSETLPVDYPTALVDQFQLNAGATSGSAATLSYNIDNADFSAYTLSPPPSPTATGAPQLLLLTP